MSPMQSEMEHAVRLLEASASSFRAWRQYLQAKAQELAAKDPEFEPLPAMLEAEIERIKATLRATSDQPSEPSERKPSAITPKSRQQRA